MPRSIVKDLSPKELREAHLAYMELGEIVKRAVEGYARNYPQPKKESK